LERIGRTRIEEKGDGVFDTVFVDAGGTAPEGVRARRTVEVGHTNDAARDGLMTPIRDAVLRRVLGDLPCEAIEVHSGPVGERRPLCILLAEDNGVNQKVLLRLLERLGYEADVANNGLEVLEFVGRKAYDLIFMDVHMPEMDGIEATRRIRQAWPKGSGPHIVALTAGAFDENRAECRAAGMEGFLSKPVRLAELASTLEALAIVNGPAV
jgi:CheY-like chemotaxis protein